MSQSNYGFIGGGIFMYRRILNDHTYDVSTFRNVEERVVANVMDDIKKRLRKIRFMLDTVPPTFNLEEIRKLVNELHNDI